MIETISYLVLYVGVIAQVIVFLVWTREKPDKHRETDRYRGPEEMYDRPRITPFPRPTPLPLHRWQLAALATRNLNQRPSSKKVNWKRDGF